DQLEDDAIAELHSWIKKEARPDKYDKKNSLLFIYWCKFGRFKIFGKKVYRRYDKDESGINYQYVVPVNDRTEVSKKVLNDPFNVAEYIQQCNQCALVKAPISFTRQPIVPNRSSRPFRLVSWDILGPLPWTDSHFPLHPGDCLPFFEICGVVSAKVSKSGRSGGLFDSIYLPTRCTGSFPFEVIYGRKPKPPVDLLFPAPELDLNLDVLSYASKVRADLLRCYETVAQNADVKVSKFKFYADRNVRLFGNALGDRVYLLKQVNKKGVSKKLSH
ncbi:hypothetical protein BpHYR1_020169, partial [Brachionus plicatilis]